jgi:transcriptional regulator with XRE-family HTH domain
MPSDSQLEIQKRFGARCRELRMQRNITATEVSHIMENTPQEVAAIESGQRNVTLKTIVGYAKALNIHPAELWLLDFSPIISLPVPSIKF